MVFSSLIFLFVFFPIFLGCYFFCKKRKVRNAIILLFSLVFYGYGEPTYVFLMMFSIFVNFFLAKSLGKKKRKSVFLVSILFNLGFLFYFKYMNFFLDTVNNLFSFHIKFLEVSLPIGISFYTFQILTYIIDVYRGVVPVQNSIIDLGCYISAFPQLIAGPIVRYDTVNEELKNRKETMADFASGIRRFIIGLAKKVILANEMAYVADTLFASSLSQIGFIGMLIGSLSYTLQIYFDFSGYSDMAIGLGRMLGFHYLENFDYPYIAVSITDFWRRWHISLSSFFRDYVYIPLGGNRCSVLKNIRNILIVWILTGLWHGASWNFVFWGLYYGLFLILEKFVWKKQLEKLPKVFQHIYTLFFVILGWIIFYFTDLEQLKNAFLSLFGFHGFGNMALLGHLQIFKVRTILLFVIALIASTPVLKKYVLKENTVGDILLILLFLISILCVLASSYNPFIYFRF